MTIRHSHFAFPCPTCGGRTYVTFESDAKDGYRRHRTCSACSYTYITLEMVGQMNFSQALQALMAKAEYADGKKVFLDTVYVDDETFFDAVVFLHENDKI